MNNIPIIKYLPEKYQGFALAFIAAFVWAAPYLTRVYHALATHGGLKGVWNAIWFGTNTPPEVKAAITSIAAAVDTINQQGASPMAAPAVTTIQQPPSKTYGGTVIL
jgi:hypothetical protein